MASRRTGQPVCAIKKWCVMKRAHAPVTGREPWRLSGVPLETPVRSRDPEIMFRKPKIMRSFAFITVFFLISIVHAENFRLKDGRCVGEKTGTPGLNANLVGQCSDFRDKNLPAQKFDTLDLSGSDFLRTRFVNGKLTGSKLDEAAFVDVDFASGHCEKTSFRGARMMGLQAMKSEWHDCRLESADLRAANFREAKLSGSSLRNADLRASYLAHASFEKVDLRGADLRDAVVFKTRFDGSSYDDSTRLPFPPSEALERGMVKLE